MESLGSLLGGLWGSCSAAWGLHRGSWLAPGWSLGSKRALARGPVWPGANGTYHPPSETLVLTPPLDHRTRGQDHREEGKVPQGELRTTV